MININTRIDDCAGDEMGTRLTAKTATKRLSGNVMLLTTLLLSRANEYP
jgi:hypothetical protein